MRNLLAIALDWAKRSFGEDQMKNPGTRALRVVEEAIELCQSVHVDKALVHQCVDEMYAREPGDPVQEIGGVLMTIYLFIASMGWMYGGDSPGFYFAKELRRVLDKEAKNPGIFAKRNAEKINLPNAGDPTWSPPHSGRSRSD
jgi:hypothetical protein